MNLQYRVLWFDDNAELFDSLDLEYARAEIARWGFEPYFDLVTNPADFERKVESGNNDLLVVDYNLEGYEHGEAFIARVRGQQVFTEIIFYSSAAAEVLWQAVHDRQLEGVYVANKLNILERILKVGYHTVRKVLDLDNMRGIVMAEVGDLDQLIGRILTHTINGLANEARDAIFSGFHTASSKHHDSHRESLQAFKVSPSVAKLLDLSDSNKLWANYNRAKRHSQLLHHELLGNYAVDILGPRNSLAHGVPQRRDDGSLVFTHREKEYAFSETVGAGLRNTIIGYKACLGEVLQRVQSAP